jgi:hypothetical protein
MELVLRAVRQIGCGHHTRHFMVTRSYCNVEQAAEASCFCGVRHFRCLQDWLPRTPVGETIAGREVRVIRQTLKRRYPYEVLQGHQPRAQSSDHASASGCISLKHSHREASSRLGIEVWRGLTGEAELS